MKRLIGSLFALGMVAASASAAAQSYGGDGDRYGDRYGSDAGYGNPGYGSGNPGGSYYDYAQVVRVDPVFDAGYRSQPAQAPRCYETTTTTAGGYGGYGGGYGGNGYGVTAAATRATTGMAVTTAIVPTATTRVVRWPPLPVA